MSDLREQIESAYNEIPEDAPIESTPVDTPESSVETTAVSSETPDSSVEKTAASTETPADKPAETAVTEPQRHRVDRAPQSWKKAEKEAWGVLPVNVRQEIHRREDQINQFMSESAQHKQFADQFQQVASPYMARLQSMGAQPMQAFEHLLQADYALATSPKLQRAQLMADLINNYDIDIDTLGQVLGGGAPREAVQPQSADISALIQQQLQQALAPMYQQQAQKQQYEQQQVTNTVESMLYDSVNYPYFETVREDMADIIEVAARRGIDIDLKDAYNRAVSLNPETSSQLQQQAVTQQAQQKNQQAQRALTASSSVTGSPSAGGSAAVATDGSLRGAIEAAFGGDRL